MDLPGSCRLSASKERRNYVNLTEESPVQRLSREIVDEMGKGRNEKVDEWGKGKTRRSECLKRVRRRERRKAECRRFSVFAAELASHMSVHNIGQKLVKR
jgi:hypothetical protein